MEGKFVAVTFQTWRFAANLYVEALAFAKNMKPGTHRQPGRLVLVLRGGGDIPAIDHNGAPIPQ
jgi:hypothetical protein